MRLAIALLVVAMPAFGQAPSQFRYAAPIELAGAQALQRVALPFEAYRDTRPNLADVRVFNARGEAVPIAFAGDPQARSEALPLVDLPVFPVSSLKTAPGGRGTEVTVRTQDGTLVSIRGRAGAASPRAAAYLLDASALKEPLHALHFDWTAGAGAEVVRLRVEASDDLKAWSALASGPVVRLENAGRVLSQPRLEFPARTAKYLRVSADSPAFALKGVRAEREHRTQPAPRATRTVSATAGPNPGEFVYDLGARLPVEAIRLVPGEANDVVAAALSARNGDKEAWRAVASAPFYRLRFEEGERESPALEIGRLPARYWMAKLAPGASSALAPVLEVQWRAAQLVFVARGEAPYTLAFGNARASGVALPVSTLMPDYERLAELRLPEARAGAVAEGPRASRWDRLVGELDARRLALWVILVAGVAVLGVMAWRLSRQMR
jgi:hypothetical protein